MKVPKGDDLGQQGNLPVSAFMDALVAERVSLATFIQDRVPSFINARLYSITNEYKHGVFTQRWIHRGTGSILVTLRLTVDPDEHVVGLNPFRTQSGWIGRHFASSLFTNFKLFSNYRKGLTKALDTVMDHYSLSKSKKLFEFTEAGRRISQNYEYLIYPDKAISYDVVKYQKAFVFQVVKHRYGNVEPLLIQNGGDVEQGGPGHFFYPKWMDWWRALNPFKRPSYFTTEETITNQVLR